MTSTKTSKPCTHELFTNNFDATKNVNIEELHCKYFDGRFYRFSLSMWKNPILHYQQFMEKPYVTFLNNYSYHISAIKRFAVCASKLWTNSEPKKHIDYWPFSGSGKQTYIHVFFCLEETAWYGSNFLTSVSAFYADTRLETP